MESTGALAEVRGGACPGPPVLTSGPCTPKAALRGRCTSTTTCLSPFPTQSTTSDWEAQGVRAMATGGFEPPHVGLPSLDPRRHHTADFAICPRRMHICRSAVSAMSWQPGRSRSRPGARLRIRCRGLRLRQRAHPCRHPGRVASSRPDGAGLRYLRQARCRSPGRPGGTGVGGARVHDRAPARVRCGRGRGTGELRRIPAIPKVDQTHHAPIRH